MDHIKERDHQDTKQATTTTTTTTTTTCTNAIAMIRMPSLLSLRWYGCAVQ
jgi:hypothetical protein